MATVALAIGEILTPGMFFLGPIAVATAGSMLVAAFGGGWVPQLAVFAAGSAAGILVLRPIARRYIRMPHAISTGSEALIGETAVVVARVDIDGGQVKIGGEIWSARTVDEQATIEPGVRVKVAEIHGATALVYE